MTNWTRREFLLGAGALAIAPSLPALPAPSRITFMGVPIIFNEPSLPAAVESDPIIYLLDLQMVNLKYSINKWLLGLPPADDVIPVGHHMKTLFDQCARDD